MSCAHEVIFRRKDDTDVMDCVLCVGRCISFQDKLIHIQYMYKCGGGLWVITHEVFLAMRLITQVYEKIDWCADLCMFQLVLIQKLWWWCLTAKEVMALYNTVVISLLMHWSYHGLVLSHWYALTMELHVFQFYDNLISTMWFLALSRWHLYTEEVILICEFSLWS